MTSKKIKVAAIVIGLGWFGYSHFVAAHQRAFKEANARSLFPEKSGYLEYCKYRKFGEINSFVKQKTAELNKKYLDKEISVLGMNALNGLLNQSFGDPNYKKFQQKYGTNPYDVLTGGLLSKVPQVAGGVIAKNKQEEFAGISKMTGALQQKASEACACQFKKAFDDTHISWTALSATFGLVRSASISRPMFAKTAEMNSGWCR